MNTGMDIEMDTEMNSGLDTGLSAQVTAQMAAEMNEQMYVAIMDHLQQLKFAKEDLGALSIIATVVEDQTDWQNDKEMLAVIRRAMEPILSDMEKAIGGIEAELVKARQN